MVVGGVWVKRQPSWLVGDKKFYSFYNTDHWFYNTISLKKHHSFYGPWLTEFTPAIQPKNLLTLQSYFLMFLVGVRKAFALHYS